ncbi:hypothetical protein ACP70R_028142 [Stipagrostis hirtigluma subsp. patula]
MALGELGVGARRSSACACLEVVDLLVQLADGVGRNGPRTAAPVTGEQPSTGTSARRPLGQFEHLVILARGRRRPKGNFVQAKRYGHCKATLIRGQNSKFLSTAALPPWKRILCRKVTSRGAQDVVHHLSAAQRRLVRAAGFGSLLDIPYPPKVNRQLYAWLLSRLDVGRMVLAVDGGGREAPVRAEDVRRVLGVPMGRRPVRGAGESERALAPVRVREMYGGAAPASVIDHEAVISGTRACDTEAEREMFLCSFVCAMVGNVLAPRGRYDKVHTEICPAVAYPFSAGEFDWCSYVVDELRDGAVRAQKALATGANTVTLRGCLLFMQVLYMDSLPVAKSMVSQTAFPRAVVYTPDVAEMLTKHDTEDTSKSRQFLNKMTITNEDLDHVGSGDQAQTCQHRRRTRCGRNNDYLVRQRRGASRAMEIFSLDAQLTFPILAETVEAHDNQSNRHSRSMKRQSCGGSDVGSPVQTPSGHHVAEVCHGDPFDDAAMADASSTNTAKFTELHQDNLGDATAGGTGCQVQSLRNRKRVYTNGWAAPAVVFVLILVVRYCIFLVTTLYAAYVKRIADAFSRCAADDVSCWVESTTKHDEYSWPRFVLSGVQPEEEKYYKVMFAGDHIGYDVGKCRMVVTVVSIDSAWSCYAWDFVARRLTILDPTICLANKNLVFKKHDDVVDKLHPAMMKCMDIYSNLNSSDTKEWKRCVVINLIENPVSDTDRSGLYSLYCAIEFDGTVPANQLTQTVF